MRDLQKALNTDFNALRTLQLVVRLGSFSAAADALGVKQSTVSYTIDRLRKLLDDPLILRLGGKNIPTAKCQEILPMVENILVQADGLEEAGQFDPEITEAEVAITTATTVATMLMPRMYRRIRVEAPNMKVAIDVAVRDVVPPLLEGRADIAIVFNEVDANGIYSHRGLANDYPVCVMDPKNPLAGKSLTIEDLTSAKHFGARLWKGWQPPYMVKARELGATIDEVLVVNELSLLPRMIRGTDIIGGVPLGLAKTFGDQIGIAYFPFHINLSMNMYWSAAANLSPLNRWLRQIAIEEAKEL